MIYKSFINKPKLAWIGQFRDEIQFIYIILTRFVMELSLIGQLDVTQTDSC